MFYYDMKVRGGRTRRRHLLRGFIVGAAFRLQFVDDSELVGSEFSMGAGFHAFTLVWGIEALHLFEVSSVEISSALEDESSVGRGTIDAELYTDFTFVRL